MLVEETNEPLINPDIEVTQVHEEVTPQATVDTQETAQNIQLL